MRITRAAAVGLAGLGLLLVALMFESSILFVPGVALVLLAATLPAWIGLAARSVRVSRTLDQDRVLEDQPLEATIRIAHGRLGLPGAEIAEALAGGNLALRTSAIHLRPAEAELRVVARFDRRGRHRLAAPAVRLADPFGLASFPRIGAAGQEILVLPRIERPRPLPQGPGRNLRSNPGARWAEALAVVEVDGLQPYRHGTPASRIHWPALARGAGLLERRLRAEAGTGPLVVLDARCHDHAEERLDRAVRAAASLTRALAARGGCELLLPGERRAVKIEADLGGWPAAHARLAVVEGAGDAPAPALTPRQGPVYYVAGELFFDPWRQGGGLLEHAILVLPAEVAAPLTRASVLEVAGCVGFALGPVARGRAAVGARTG